MIPVSHPAKTSREETIWSLAERMRYKYKPKSI